MKTSLILPLLATLPITLAQSSSSSSTLHIPGPMEQSVTALSGTRSVTSTTSSSPPTVSIPGPMEQSITTSASDSSTTVEPASTATTSSTTASSSSEAPGGGNDATRTGVSQSQGTSGAEAVIGVLGMEQMVMMGLGVGAALAV